LRVIKRKKREEKLDMSYTNNVSHTIYYAKKAVQRDAEQPFLRFFYLYNAIS